ncbi:MAG: hypothetical protein PHY02_09960 [Phycisphaerae bacterium]|nr:hypothetical protein [Phycisphaerae bacterium]
MAGPIYIFRCLVLDCVAAMGNAKSNIDTVHIKPISTKHIIGFFCAFVLIYVPLMVPWPGLALAAAYSKLYRTGVAFLFESLTPEGVVRFQPLSDVENDIRIIFYNRDQTGPVDKMLPVGHIDHNSRREGYIYAAFLTALILAGPIPWRRKGWALLWGMILIHAFIVLKLAIWITYGLNKEPLSIVVLSPFWNKALLLTIQVFASNLTFGLVVSVFIWVLVSFRREDWFKVLPSNRLIRPSV